MFLLLATPFVTVAQGPACSVVQATDYTDHTDRFLKKIRVIREIRGLYTGYV